MSDSYFNPYQAPDPAVETSVEISATEPAASCVLIHTSSQHRILFLRGSVNAVIEWYASGFRQFVAVNGKRISSRVNFLLADLWEFDLQVGDRTHHAAIELNLFLRSFLRGVRLRVDGQVVYSDGKWPHS